MTRVAVGVSVLALLLLIGGQAVAQVLGPVFPPPGGVTWSFTGNMGLSGGADLSFQNFDLTQTDDLWWTSVNTGSLSTPPVWISLSGGPFSGYLSYDATSPLGTGIARWYGLTLWNCPIPGYEGGRTVNTRFTLTFTPNTNLSVGASHGISRPYVHTVGGDFTVNLLAEGRAQSGPLSSAYTPINNFPQYTAGTTQIHHWGGFYYTDPEPGADDSPELATWLLLACTGGIGALARRRKRD